MADRAGIPRLGSQWNEARGIDRVLAKNPEAQAHSMMLLLGLVRLYEMGPQTPTKQKIIEGLSLAIMDLTVAYPDYLAEGEIDADLGGGHYKPNPQLTGAVHDVLSSQEAYQQ